MTAADFDNLVVKHADFLKPYAVSLTKDHEDAKDLYQETMMRALLNKDKYQFGTNLKAWMYTIMRNIFINDYRKRSRQQLIFDNTPNDFLLDYNQKTVSNTAEINLAMKDIAEAMDKLPNIFRIPFQMYYEGYKYNEIADQLHEPLGTIKSRIHFARKLLKEQLRRY